MRKATNQEYWDSLLITTWLHDEPYGSAVMDMQRYANADELENIDIKRKLGAEKFYKIPIRALMAQTLPKTSAFLWHVFPLNSDDEYAKAQSILCVEKAKSNRTVAMIHRKDKYAEKAHKAHHRRVDINAGHRRRDWDKVK